MLFRQSRYKEQAVGDYLNAPFTKESYDVFIDELLAADRVIKKDFETGDLFQACQPIEEIARKGHDAPRFGTCKPVGLTDPATGRRPWAAVQLRAENADLTAYNLVGFPDQSDVSGAAGFPHRSRSRKRRVRPLRRDASQHVHLAPELLDRTLYFEKASLKSRSMWLASFGYRGLLRGHHVGLVAALSVYARLSGVEMPVMPRAMAFGALLDYATDPNTEGYQPMHVNFGIMEPFEQRIRNKRERYAAYARRGAERSNVS